VVEKQDPEVARFDASTDLAHLTVGVISRKFLLVESHPVLLQNPTGVT
jgi:hypothetical protein